MQIGNKSLLSKERNMKKKIILASQSPRRKEILTSLGIEFEIISSNYEEDSADYSDPAKMVQEFAYQKAKEVFDDHPDAIVIGADTDVFDADGNILGKAENRAHAKEMILSLQGRENIVYSAVAMISSERVQRGIRKIVVRFKSMTSEQIDAYLDDPQADWMDKAGAYAVQGKAAEWIKSVEGEDSAIIGLSTELVQEFLQKEGIPTS